MISHEAILDIIEEAKLCPHPVSGEANLYSDLGFDSLSFAHLLIKIEEAFSIKFGIAEMHKCVLVNDLITAVVKKLVKGGRSHAT